MADQTNSGAYRVLARKYRPQSFADLIGQEAMVRTLSNAFSKDRIHQAYIFTGVRGVGKTTTARIIARALNYEKDDGTVAGPTVEMPDFGRHCQSIIDSRHVDVIEMDAASHTGIADVREIIEGVRYRPAYARYKVYIIDEVHMLSTQAFNGLLKTLEEPPEHVKFLFATTEIRKVPVTVLSRCQRFDLKRIDPALMMAHIAGIAAKERAVVEEAALAMLVRAGEGSVRDTLSLLDQAIAHGGGEVTAGHVRDMLGLADRARVIDLFDHLMRGDMQAVLAEVASQFGAGADPVTIIADLADYVHTVTRLKLAGDTASDPTITPEEARRGQDFARRLGMRVLTRAWQILTRGLPEVQHASRPMAAAEMLLVRLAFAADLPTPDEALKLLKDGGGASTGVVRAAPAGAGGAPSAGLARVAGAYPAALPMQAELPRDAAAPRLRIDGLPQLVALAAERRDVQVKAALERDIRPVRLEHGVFEFGLVEGAPTDIVQLIGRRLQEWTGQRWTVALASQADQPTIREMARRAEEAGHAERVRDLGAIPLVRALLEAFPGAEIIRERLPAAEAEAAADEPDDDGLALGPEYTDDDL
jgi:DNA polymerase-3 subunit gamma/tau